jgi:hypothetical protein
MKTCDPVGEVADSEDADVMLFNGDILRPLDYEFIDFCRDGKQKDNVVLVLVTEGGDADVAYKMSRCLQENYANITVFVTGWCKSAGTLMAVGAHRLVIGAKGELGPLDIQLGQKDELFEYTSGLNVGSAIEQLGEYAFRIFENHMLNIINRSSNRITFRTACNVASGMAAELFRNVYGQIDPMKVGETARLMEVARDYGKRLAASSGNIDDRGIDMLVRTYSSHSFVIDFQEAREIFFRVDRPSASYEELERSLGDQALYPVGGRPIMRRLRQSSDGGAKENGQTDQNAWSQYGEGEGGVKVNFARPVEAPPPTLVEEGAFGRAIADDGGADR